MNGMAMKVATRISGAICLLWMLTVISVAVVDLLGRPLAGL